MAERFSLYDIVCPDLMTVSDLRRILHIGRNKDTVVGKGSKEANANDYYDLEKSGHYYILVQWSEHGKRFRKNCATGLAATAKNERKAEKLRQQTLAEWEQKICPNYSDILFSDYLRLWLEDIEPTVSPFYLL